MSTFYSYSDGLCIPIESKSSTVVGPDDTKGIQAFARANPDNFFRGCVAYCGNRVVDLTPAGLPARTILALPIHGAAQLVTALTLVLLRYREEEQLHEP
jgi:hypothetical protein